MTEEEQKAIKTIKSLKEVRCYSSYAFDDGTEILDEEEKKDIDVILNLISKLQEENKELREGKDTAENELKSQLEENKKLQKDIEIKDKVIENLYSDIEYEYQGTNYLKSLVMYLCQILILLNAIIYYLR